MSKIIVENLTKVFELKNGDSKVVMDFFSRIQEYHKFGCDFMREGIYANTKASDFFVDLRDDFIFFFGNGVRKVAEEIYEVIHNISYYEKILESMPAGEERSKIVRKKTEYEKIMKNVLWKQWNKEFKKLWYKFFFIFPAILGLFVGIGNGLCAGLINIVLKQAGLL